MIRQERSIKEKRTSRRDTYTLVGILTYIGSLLFRIPLFYMIGEKGVGYFGIVYELYIIIAFFFSYGLSEATATLIRYRIKREQFKNAIRVLHSALVLGGVFGIVICVGLLGTGNVLAEKIMGMSLCGLAISVMAPSVIFSVLTGVLKGYFQGNGSRVVAIHSKIMEMLFLYIGGLAGAYVAYGYGQKVSNLLLNESYAPAYGAMGACVGILVSSVLCFFHSLLLYFLYRRRSKKQEYRDSQKYIEKRTHIVHMLVWTALPYAATGMMFHGLPFLSGCLYIHMSGNVAETVLLWGSYYGKYYVVIGVLAALLSTLGIEPVRRVIYWTEREEFRAVREKFACMIQQCVLWTAPVAVFTAVLAENILNVFFKGNNMITATWIMWGSIIIVLYVFAIVFTNILIRLRRLKHVLLYAGAAIVIATGSMYVLLANTQLGILSLVIGNIIFYAVLTVAGFVLVTKSFQYVHDWIRGLAFPVVAAGIAGLIVMLLNKAFLSMTGSTISMLISLFVGCAAYTILLLAIRCVNERELENMFMGRLLIGIGRALHFL